METSRFGIWWWGVANGGLRPAAGWVLHPVGNGLESGRAYRHDAGALLDGDCHAGDERAQFDGFADGAQRVLGAAVPGHCRYSAGGDDPVAGGQWVLDDAGRFRAVRTESGGGSGAGGSAWTLCHPSAAAVCCPLRFARSVQRRGAVPGVWLWSAAGRGRAVNGDGGVPRRRSAGEF